MRWLLLKDLQILRRSPLLVALLVLYPVIIAVLIGFALSRGPDKPEVAFYNGLEGKSAVVELGGDRIDLAKEGSRLFDAIDPVRVNSRQEAIQKVKDGDVLGALIIPSDLASNIQSQLEPGTVEVYYNAEDPAKQAVRREHDQGAGADRQRRAHEARRQGGAPAARADQQGRRSTASSARTSTCSGLKNAETILAKARKELRPAPPSAPSSTA